MSSDGQVKESVACRYAVLRPYLDERQRRLVAAVEAAGLGRGGITVVVQASGVHPDTVAKGVRDSAAALSRRGGCGCGCPVVVAAGHRTRSGAGACVAGVGAPHRHPPG